VWWLDGKQMAAERSGRNPNHSGIVRLVVKLSKVDKSDFEKIKSKNFKKVVDLRLRAVCGG
jgi:hypothetical protein